MRRFLATLAIAGMSAASPGWEPAFSAELGNDSAKLEVQYAATFSVDDLIYEQQQECCIVHLKDCDLLKEPGKPMLPAKTIRLALPPGMSVASVRLVGATPVRLDGEYTVCPAQPPQPKSDRLKVRGFVAPDPHVYTSCEPYPATPVELVGQTDLAGQGIALVRLYPVQYVPARKELRLHTAIAFVLEGSAGYECGDNLPSGISRSGRRRYEQRVRDMVANPDDVVLQVSPDFGLHSRGVGAGAYEYVIITQSAWVADFQPLADWRTKAGHPATIVSTDWIYNNGGYSGSNLEKIRAFVEDAHNNWGATFFLLGGDTNTIPYHVRTITVPGYWTDDIPNDTYYADYDEDWVCEVDVGRAPVRTTSAIATFVDKILTYEKDPPTTNYVTTALFVGMDITDPGDQDGEICKERIRSMHLPVSWTLNTEYDREPGTHRADVIAYLNQGHHMFNHHDHCNTTNVGLGWINHGDLLTIADVNGLTNGDRQSIAFAVGCYPCDIPYHTSIGEAFIQNSGGGAIAFMGNSRTGWGGPTEDPDWYSVRQDRLFYEALLDQGIYRLGECYTYAKNNEFDPYDPYNLHQYCFTQLHLLGDPQLSIWTEDPEGLAVVHAETLPVGDYVSFPVQVYSGGSPLDNATVCLWKAGDVYEIEETYFGLATFWFLPDTTGTMHVTVSRHDYLPYEGQAEIQAEHPCAGQRHCDCNGDGSINGLDIDPLVDALVNPDQYNTTYAPLLWECTADINCDGSMDGLDIDPFVLCLTSWCPDCPE